MGKRKAAKSLQKIFVTGASGFIGRHLVHKLISEGFTVGALVRSESSFGTDVHKRDIKLFFGDLRKYNDVKKAIATFRPDAIIHLVTYYAVMHRADEVEIMVDTNVKGTLNLLEAAKEIEGVNLFINTSSCAVYEQKKHAIKETDSIRPQNLYALTKVHAEEACEYYATEYGMPCVTLRVFPPYGPGDHERRLIPYVIGCLLNNVSPNLTTGKQEWDFVFVSDIVAAYIAVLRSYPFKKNHSVFNIGTGNPLSIRSVVEKIHKETGSAVSLPWGSVAHRTNEVWHNSADITKAKKELNWSPGTGIDEGLQNTIVWFRKHF